jgi:hypothetical protein
VVASDTRGQHGGAGFRVRTRSPLTNALDLLGSTRGEYRRVVSYQPSTPVALCEAPTGLDSGEAPPTTKIRTRNVPVRRLFVDPTLAIARALERAVLDRVGDVGSDRSVPASAPARSSSRPVGPTNVAPSRSSTSPGCSPTNTTVAPAGQNREPSESRLHTVRTPGTGELRRQA